MFYWFPLVLQLYNWKEVTALKARGCMKALGKDGAVSSQGTAVFVFTLDT